MNPVVDPLLDFELTDLDQIPDPPDSHIEDVHHHYSQPISNAPILNPLSDSHVFHDKISTRCCILKWTWWS